MDQIVKEQVSECLSCKIPRCEKGCPVHNHICDFIFALKQDDMEQAGRILHAQNPFPELTSRLCDCDRQCQGHCVKGIRGTSVSIQQIERSIADHTTRTMVECEQDQGSVCIVGAGIAGCAIAYRLIQNGYRVTVIDQNSGIGGAILTGIPSYRFDHSYLDVIYNDLKEAHVEFRFNQHVDHDDLSTLMEEYDDVVLAIGAQKNNMVGFEEGNGYVSGLSLLYDLNVLHKQNEYKNKVHHAVVWGGGNVAMDCARSLIRCVDQVTVLYRRSEKEMPANVSEIKEAKEEGVQFEFLKTIDDLNVVDGSLQGIMTQDMELGEEGSDGRRKCFAVEDSYKNMDCDLVVAAIGQKVDFTSFVSDLVVNKDHTTNKEHLFVCGDCYFGPSTVAACIRDGLDVSDLLLENHK